MTERPGRDGDPDPKPTQESDAQRVSEEEAKQVPGREHTEPAESEDGE